MRNLSKWGFDGLAKTKKIPDWVFRIPRDLQISFLKGYVEADGHDTGYSWSLEAANQELIIQLRMLAIHAGLTTSNIEHRNRVAHLDGRSIPSETWGCDIYPEPKKTEAQILGNNDWISDDLRYERVSKITLGAPERTYDLKIAQYHNFFADGLLVHNSGGGVFFKKDGRYVGMLVMGAGEGFNLIVPVRRMHSYAKSAGVDFTMDPSVEPPDEEKLWGKPVEGLPHSNRPNDSSQKAKSFKYWILDYTKSFRELDD
jgi:hypothetical protein